jgi:hypothetical protein
MSLLVDFGKNRLGSYQNEPLAAQIMGKREKNLSDL